MLQDFKCTWCTSRYNVKYILTINPLQFILDVKIWNNLFTVLHVLSFHWWKLFWFCLLLLTNITVSNAGNYTEPGFDWELVPELQQMLALIPISKWLAAHADDKITYVHYKVLWPQNRLENSSVFFLYMDIRGLSFSIQPLSKQANLKYVLFFCFLTQCCGLIKADQWSFFLLSVL